jgi:hypothetical protein
MDCRPCKKENACVVTGLWEATTYNGEGQEIVQCSNALSHATIALLNEPRASDKSSDFVLFSSGLTQTALEVFCMQLL